MRTLTLPLRWSLRDLRSHLAKVAAIALVIAIGTGGYAGLTSTTEWRRISYAASYDQLAMYDLRVDLAPGAVTEQGTLIDAVAGIPSRGMIAEIEERLIVPIQVDASTATETVIVRGELTGSDFSDGGPHVNAHHPMAGRLLTQADAGDPVVMLETAFADFYDLPDAGHISVSGDRRLEYTGKVSTPEYFTVAPQGEVIMSEANFAGVFTTLETAQTVAGAPGQVNNLVLVLAEGADRSTVAADLERAVAGMGGSVATRDDNLSYSSLISDIDQDQASFNALALLLIVGAVGAAVNLIHRMVQEQRREIGIGLALGVRPRILAVRPLLVSAQISMLGVLFGIGVGVAISRAMGAMFIQLIPLPLWDTSFQVGTFVPVAIAGAVLPLLASAIPVWNAVRVAPIDAIRPTHLTVVGHGRRGRHHHRASTLTTMPFHNLVRSRRRTALTVLGLAAAVTVFVGFLGFMDSLYEAIDVAESEATTGSPDRITVGLDTFHLTASPEVTSIVQAESVTSAEPTLSIGGSLRSDAGEIDVMIGLADLHEGTWQPTITQGSMGEGGGVIITEKAARDLGVEPGDTVVLHHPRRQGLTSYTMVDTELPVLGLHPYPVRGFVYMDAADAGVFNLAGVANGLNLRPAPGATTGDVQRELFELEWVSSVQEVKAVTEAVRNAFAPILGVVNVMAVAVMVLALLIAFNTASINLESRAREHATMFAFGVRVGTALRMSAVESFILGLFATGLGIAGGLGMVWWMTQRVLTETIPEFAIGVVLRPETIGLTAAMGILAVVIAPLFTLRRMRRMDLPGTLRLVE